ncbi:hypothetical protein [Streptomyces sp. WAC04657]|uniref:hypothetical protein n=1 Tax=Streptomyces sp. WAC04657 TaxID=1779145 RepID=UPI001F270ACB|nr:hypothetical protein [Streptomyces sp. WAC04657]
MVAERLGEVGDGRQAVAAQLLATYGVLGAAGGALLELAGDQCAQQRPDDGDDGDDQLHGIPLPNRRALVARPLENANSELACQLKVGQLLVG